MRRIAFGRADKDFTAPATRPEGASREQQINALVLPAGGNLEVIRLGVRPAIGQVGLA
jgi:hypothetical protein